MNPNNYANQQKGPHMNHMFASAMSPARRQVPKGPAGLRSPQTPFQVRTQGRALLSVFENNYSFYIYKYCAVVVS